MNQAHQPLAPRTVEVSVAASSANLGPGFDAVGLALDLRDEVTVSCRPASDPGAPRTTVRVQGQGAGDVALDERHLVARWVRGGLAGLGAGADLVDLELDCRNVVPHGRGLGSSAAAIVAGLAAAWALVHGELDEVDGLSRSQWLVATSSAAEGHGDNAAASVLGGAVLAWSDGSTYRAAPLDVTPDLAVVTCVPEEVLMTEVARSLLPATVPHSDAAFTGARTGLLVQALRGVPDLLLPATEDRIHQQQRAGAMPRSHDLLVRLRAAGVAAAVSGAGPSLLCLGAERDTVAAAAGEGWSVRAHQVGTPVCATVLA
ncbi:homoserine kinase [Jannaschia sp. R86511]|uniref:homoserine kinase n=1 Tax=Jannaschia sp. R86511 TaxID=3093853 RepID=UPI0036D36097